MPTDPTRTPDGRYLVVEGKAGPRLWRASNPGLPEDVRRELVSELMAARRAVKAASSDSEMKQARARVNRAKVGLGERGPAWWDDGAPDFNRRLIKNSPYAEWWNRTSKAL